VSDIEAWSNASQGALGVRMGWQLWKHWFPKCLSLAELNRPSNGLKFICNPISNGIYYTFVSKLSSCSARAQTQTIMVMFVEW